MSRAFLRACIAACGAVILFAGCEGDRPPDPAKDLSHLTPIEYGKPISFGAGGGGDQLKLTGWAPTEPFFTWSDGVAASLAMRLPRRDAMVQLRFKMSGMNVAERVPFQKVEVFANAHKMARWRVSDEKVFTVALPENFVTDANGLLIIDFFMPTADSPAALGIGGDMRRLGIRMSELTVIEIARFDYGQTVRFGGDGEADRIKLDGWARAEPYFTWTDGESASMVFCVPPAETAARIRFRMCGMNVRGVLPFQPVDLYVNGEKLATWEVSDENDFSVELPPKFLQPPSPLLTVEFRMPKATSPASLKAGPDGRRLGIRMSEMTILHSSAPAASTSAR